MTYSEALAWLYSTQQFGIKLGLANVRRLLDELGSPEHGCQFLHVAGTNGKGSVCAFMDSILRAEGYRSGLYTSPHLISFQERIRVNGEPIAEDEVAEGLRIIRGKSQRWDHSPTFFEITTALALWHFARAKVDHVVLETGMGGRLDATNIVLPLVSVITSLALDHSQWLGDTLAKIAAEKAGIIKPGVPVVSAAQEKEAAVVLQAAADRLGSPLRFVDQRLEGFKIGLAGAHQSYNAAVAVEAIRAAGISVNRIAIERGLADVTWPGRFQRVGRFVLDGAHNPQAARQLGATWRAEFGDHARATVIFGALADKDYASILAELNSIAADFLFVPVASARTESPSKLRDAVGRGKVAGSLVEALKIASASECAILVTGSLFLVGEALSALSCHEG